MVDDITEDDVERIEGRIPADATSQEDVEDIMQSKYNNFSDFAIKRFAERIAENRTPERQREREVLQDQTAVSGEGAAGSGSRTTMLRDSEGQYFGSKSDVSTYTDRWGNVMGYNESTGKRKKIVDSSEVNQ